MQIAIAALFAVASGANAQALTKLVFSTDWLAQAEHGGFYQAQAEGIYRKYGLDVEIRMGGPQVNGLQLLAAGRLDVAMADALQVLSAVEQNVPVLAVAATFQKNPTVLIAHPGVARIEDLKGKPIAIGSASNTTFWPWLREQYRFTDDQKRPYGFSVQPFLADAALSQQGFATSEPFSIERAASRRSCSCSRISAIRLIPKRSSSRARRSRRSAARSSASSARRRKAGSAISPIRRRETP
jgi:NitT/TauT family transport system substrate-binding protein